MCTMTNVLAGALFVANCKQPKIVSLLLLCYTSASASVIGN